MTEILPDSQYDIKIKWPNDILVNRQKIAGILIENNFTNTMIQYTVVGIGLNVNQIKFNEFERIATSLKLLTGKDYDRNVILERLCVNLEKWYFKLKEQKFALIDDNYLSCLFGMKQSLNFTDSNQISFVGKILGVTKNGLLNLELPDLSIKKFDIKEIKFSL